MVCHSSDPASPDYGGTIIVKPDAKPHECAGALGLVVRYIDEINRIGFDAHRAIYPTPFTRGGMLHWVERIMFGNVPAVDGYRINDLGLPWTDVPLASHEPESAGGERS
jgi:hypothetical protein